MENIVADLKAAGFDFDSVSDLRTSGVRYSGAIPILLKWLPVTDDLGQKEQIVWALSVPFAHDALNSLITEFLRLPLDGDTRTESVRWAIGNALEVLWDDSKFEELASLALDRRFGKAREMIVLGLRRSKHPQAGATLIELLDDPVVSGHAAEAVGKFSLPQARISLERLRKDDRAWVRKAARRGLAKLT